MPLILRKMEESEVYVSVSLEADADEPIADLAYRGSQWASLKRVGGDLVLTVYGAVDLPLTAALAALDEGARRLEAHR